MKIDPRAISGLFVWPALLGLASCDSHKEDSRAEAPDIKLVEDCTTAVGGAPWEENQPYESVPGIEEELESLDLESLPETIDISSMLALYRGFIGYALEIDAAELGDSLNRDETLAKGKLGEVVLGALDQGDDVLGIDFSFFRRGFHRYYTCSRGFPATLDDFVATYGDYETWEYSDVDSLAKCDTRRLRPDSEQQVWVAQTLVGDQVRETEILLGGHRIDNALDFLVYDDQGQLSDRSKFPTLDNGPAVVAAAPYVCMACHIDQESVESTWAFTLQRPAVGPCAK